MRVRLLDLDDEVAAEDAHRVMAAEGFTFLLDRDRATSFPDYLALLEDLRLGRNVPADRVRGTFLVAEVAGELVGRVSIRHELNIFLEREGGHVGYGVLPAHRGRGYATAMLRHALGVLAADGLDTALVTCADENLASRATIERCGGSLIDVVEVSSIPIRRYAVPTLP